MPGARDIWKDLPELEWAGLKAPSAVLGFSWENTLPERRYPYIAGSGHDDTGLSAIEFTARLYFDTCVAFNAFPELWNKWRPALMSGSTDNLKHPILGVVRARVKRTSADTAPTVRSGFSVDVSWVSSLDDPEETRELANVHALSAQGAAAAAAAKAVQVDWPDGSYEPSLEEALRKVESAAFGFAQGLSSYAAKVSGTVSTMVDSVSRLTDPLAQPAFDGLLAVWMRVEDIRKKAELANRQTSSRRIASDTTLDAFASLTGNTLQEIMQLNPLMLRAPTVSAPADLVYYVQ